MVVGIELAVAMRAKGGSNFLLQRYSQHFWLSLRLCCSILLCDDQFCVACSWGIGAKLANDSMHSAAAVLAEYASNGGQGDVDK